MLKKDARKNRIAIKTKRKVEILKYQSAYSIAGTKLETNAATIKRTAGTFFLILKYLKLRFKNSVKIKTAEIAKNGRSTMQKKEVFSPLEITS